MRAFVMTGAEEGSIQNLPCFAPEPGDAVVQTAATAICTTERRIFAGSLKVSYPVIGGHEVSGIVVETPDDSSNLKVGDKVVLDAINRCGFCYHCIRGHSNLCEKAYHTERRGYRIVGGGFGQFVTISTKRVFRYWGTSVQRKRLCPSPWLAVFTRSNVAGFSLATWSWSWELAPWGCCMSF